MSKSRWPSKRFLLCTTVLAALPLGVFFWKSRVDETKPPKPYHFPSAELALLNKIVQKRFQDTEEPNFGIYRSGPLHSAFVPYSEEEKGALKAIGAAKMKVLLYAVGNGPSPWRRKEGITVMPVKGPVFFTGKIMSPDASGILDQDEMNSYMIKRAIPTPADAPTDETLRVLAKRVREESEFRNGATAESGRWQIVAVPVVAGSKECLQCHKTRPAPEKAWFSWQHPKATTKLGDILGMAVYCATKE